MVDNVKLQSALRIELRRALTALEIIFSAGHPHQVRVGARKDAVKVRHLYIRFQRNALFPGKRAVRGVGQRLHPCPARVALIKLSRLFVYTVFGAFVCRNAAVQHKPFLQYFVFLRCEALLCFGKTGRVGRRRAGKKLIQLLYSSFFRGQPLLGSAKRFFGALSRLTDFRLLREHGYFLPFGVRRIFILYARAELIHRCPKRRESALCRRVFLLRCGEGFLHGGELFFRRRDLYGKGFAARSILFFPRDLTVFIGAPARSGRLFGRKIYRISRAKQLLLLLRRFPLGRVIGGSRAAGGLACHVYSLLRGSGSFLRFLHGLLVRRVGRALRGTRVVQRAADGTRLAVTKRGRQHARLLVVESAAQLPRRGGKLLHIAPRLQIDRKRVIRRRFPL